MAILSKIRDRSLALIAVIGLALFAFVLDPSTLSDFFNSSKINEIGEVDGETISRQEFAEAVDSYKSRTGNRGTEMQVANFVWNNLLREKIYTNQLEKAGVTLGESDVWNKLLTLPAVNQNPQFLNEAGLFDEDLFKQFLADAQVNNPDLYNAWMDYMSRIESDLKRDTYNNLVNAGLGASLKEGELQFLEENIKVSGNLVYIPYATIPDSLVTVKKSDIEAYIKQNPKKYKREASRNLSYVVFKNEATPADREAIKQTVGGFIEDRKEFSTVTKSEVTVKGLQNADNYVEFFEDSKSDVPLLADFIMELQIPKPIAEDVLKGNKGDVFGPYEDLGFFKLSKIDDIKVRPDSVKSSHILIPFVGSLAANETTSQTEEQAKKSADSIFKLVRRNKTKFAEVADEINGDASKGKGGDIGWTTHAAAFSPNFDNDFANFIFDNNKGDVEVVKSKFGFHIIRIDDQKNKQKAVKLITFGRRIQASTDTENKVFQDAETFALEVSKSSITDAAKERNLRVNPAIGLKILDENIPGLGNQRSIVTWAFGKDAELGDFRRFDLEDGYAVAAITAKYEEGLAQADRMINAVRPIVVNEKKAALIAEKMNGSSLQDIAEANGVKIKNISDVSLKSPSITGVGFEPKVIGAMMNSGENNLVNKVEGSKGVFAFVVTKVETPDALPNYDAFRKRLADTRKSKTVKIFDALKEASDVEDYRASFYGVN